MLANPLAKAISVTGMSVSASRRRAVCSRVVLASAIGVVPSVYQPLSPAL